jgi:single-strand DNA-binding protein
MNLNIVYLIGRLTRDVESRFLPSGKQVANIGLATDRVYNNKEGEKQQKAEFHNVVLFEPLALTAIKYLKKGSLAMISGRIQTKEWTDASGIKRYRTEIIATELQLGPKTENDKKYDDGQGDVEIRPF